MGRGVGQYVCSRCQHSWSFNPLLWSLENMREVNSMTRERMKMILETRRMTSGCRLQTIRRP